MCGKTVRVFLHHFNQHSLLPQAKGKKRQKEEQEMRSSLEIGDEIITIGGIVGKVVTIREEDLVIETGADRTKMKIQRWAVNTNVTKTEQHRKEVEAAREAAKEKKNNKAKKDKE